jgi:hypothetical protein
LQEHRRSPRFGNSIKFIRIVTRCESIHRQGENLSRSKVFSHSRQIPPRRIYGILPIARPSIISASVMPSSISRVQIFLRSPPPPKRATASWSARNDTEIRGFRARKIRFIWRTTVSRAAYTDISEMMDAVVSSASTSFRIIPPVAKGQCSGVTHRDCSRTKKKNPSAPIVYLRVRELRTALGRPPRHLFTSPWRFCKDATSTN